MITQLFLGVFIVTLLAYGLIVLEEKINGGH